MKKILPFLLPVRSIIFILVFTIGAAITNNNLSDISNWWSVVATATNIVTIVILLLAARVGKMTYAGLINYKKGQTKIRQIILMTVLILSAGMGLMYVAGFICYGVFPYMAPMMCAPINKYLAIINLILLPVTTALAEDGLYLGAGVNQIKNKYAAVVVPAFFFALQHCFIPTLWDVRYMLYRFLSFLPLTVILCAYYHKKRNPLPVMVGHAFIDMATGVMIMITSVDPGLYAKWMEMA